MWKTIITVTVASVVSTATYLLGIWTGGNPETFCNATSGVMDPNNCMNYLGQVINFPGDMQ